MLYMKRLSPKEKISKARISLLERHPFFGFLAMHLKILEDKACPTVGVAADGTVAYNPDFVERLSEEELQFVVAHEVLHLALDHPGRRNQREVALWNVAIDYATNLYLVGAGLRRPSWVLFDTAYLDMAAEEIYEKLKRERDATVELKLPLADTYKDKRDLNADNLAEARTSGKKCGFDTHNLDKPAKNEWKQITAAAVQYAKGRGNMPGFLEELIDAVLYPRQPWSTILLRYFNDAMRMNSTWKKPDKRYLHRREYLPGPLDEYPKVIIALDTSGSISRDNFKVYLTEVKGILSLYEGHLSAWVVCCDTRITYAEELSTFGVEKIPFRGRGGTDFRPVFEWAKNHEPKLLIYFTDADGIFPDEAPGYPVIWCVTSNLKVPFGDRIQIEAGK